MRLGKDTGSLVNWIQGSAPHGNPVVGEGATVYHWSDRSPYTVLEVSEDGKSCVVRRCKAIRTDNNGMSEMQDYRFEEDERMTPEKLVYRNGAWRNVVEVVLLEKEPEDFKSNPEKYFKEDGWLKHTPPYTKLKRRFPKVNIRFGHRDSYYDYSF